MLKLDLLVILCLIKSMKSENNNINTPIVIKLTADQIVDTLKSVISSKYIKQMANEIAQKAGEHFIEQMKNKNKNVRVRDINNHVRKRPPPSPSKKEKEETSVLSESVAMALLNEPSPDGDNLELDSLELTTPSRARDGHPQKVNGIYFRRLLSSVRS